MPTQGSPEAGRMRNKKSKTSEKAAEEFRKAYWALFDQDKKEPTVVEMAEYMNTTQKTIYYRVRRLPDFKVIKGQVHAENNEDAKDSGAEEQEEDLVLSWDAEIADDEPEV